MFELSLQYGGLVKVHSMYGTQGKADGNKYFPQLLFAGFGGHRIRFVLKSIKEGRKSRIVLLSHINLLLVGYLVKRIRPSVKLVLLAHGIEVWEKLPAWKRRMLHRCDLVLPVSHFTRDRMIEIHGLPKERFIVINNCLDPLMELPLNKDKSTTLMDRYGLNKENTILLTVSRMRETEIDKGYDKVLQAISELGKNLSGLRYLLLGDYDEMEKKRLDEKIRELRIEQAVIFAGMIPDDEMADHFRLADLFIMPSTKEGFGIVFIEAMFYGLPVIAGNKDGSCDALGNGEFGILADPDNINGLTEAVKTMLQNPGNFRPDLSRLIGRFGYPGYKEQLNKSLSGLLPESAN